MFIPFVMFCDGCVFGYLLFQLPHFGISAFFFAGTMCAVLCWGLEGVIVVRPVLDCLF